MAYIPALRFDALTRLYDPLLRLTLSEDRLRRRLVAAAGLGPEVSVLDVGCGTGTLAVLAARAGARVHALDGDPNALAIAREKALAAQVDVDFRHGTAWELPWEDGTFDRVFSTLMLHHLTPDEKLATLRDCRRVLRGGGKILVADWGRPHDLLMRAAFYAVQALDGFATTTENVEGRIPDRMREAGFQEVSELARERTVYGTLAFYGATA